MKVIQLALAFSLPLYSGDPVATAADKGEVDCSSITTAGKIKWGALSGLTSDHNNPDKLYTVHDRNLPNPEIYTLDVSDGAAVIVSSTQILRKGKVPKYDLEGISRRRDGGFWLASEGKAGHKRDNLIIRVTDDGVVQEKVRLPDEVRRYQVKGGFEGISSIGSGRKERVAVAFQHAWKDDPKGMVKIGLYWPSGKQWRFFRYPLEQKKGVGLSAIAALDDSQFLVLERDNKSFKKAKIQRIYRISLAKNPKGKATDYPVLDKTLLVDLLAFRQVKTCGSNGKLEGMTVGADKQIYLVNDDDGKADAMLLRLNGFLKP